MSMYSFASTPTGFINFVVEHGEYRKRFPSPFVPPLLLTIPSSSLQDSAGAANFCTVIHGFLGEPLVNSRNSLLKGVPNKTNNKEVQQGLSSVLHRS